MIYQSHGDRRAGWITSLTIHPCIQKKFYRFTLNLRRILSRRWAFSVIEKVVALAILYLLVPVTIFAQDSTKVTRADTLHYESEPITIRATRIHAGWSKQPIALFSIDSVATQMISGSVADILSMQAPVFLKNYGPGGIATLSQRGLGAHQTQVLWEGMELNHPMLGVIDLSLLPSSIISTIEMGGANPSAAYGGGGLGGTVYMKSQKTESGISIEQRWNQLENLSTQAQAGWISENQKWNGLVSGSYSANSNEFQYHNPITQHKETRDHNSVHRQSVLGKVSYAGERVDWTTIWWWNRADQEVPGSVASGISDARQNDSFVRGLLRADWYAKGINWKVETGGSKVRLDYEQTKPDVDSKSASWSSSTSLQLRQFVSEDLQWKAVGSLDYQWIDTNNYADLKSRMVNAALVNATWQINDRWRVFPALRVDRYSDFGWAISPSIGLNREVVQDRLYLFANASRNFNPPTFNDLYWVPGGDPDLNPERSVQLEWGGRWIHPRWGRHQISAYRMWVTNGIQWIPNSQGIFEATNIENLRGYGIEWTSDIPLLIKPLRINWHHRGMWTRSEINAARFQGDQAVGLQLPYVPELNLKEQIVLRKQNVSVQVGSQWVSTRYTTEEHFGSLEPYWVTNMGLSYRTSIPYGKEDDSARIQVSIRVDNILDNAYEVVEYFPMPGRYISAAIRISL